MIVKNMSRINYLVYLIFVFIQKYNTTVFCLIPKVNMIILQLQEVNQCLFLL